eukprot:scaffold12895_cov164-Skeletonema_dohrnii-CCMP3373.AAC.6
MQHTDHGYYHIKFIQVRTHQISRAFYCNKKIRVRTKEHLSEPISLCIECWNHLRTPRFDENGDARPEDEEVPVAVEREEEASSVPRDDDEEEGAARRGEEEEETSAPGRRRRRKLERDPVQNEFKNTAYAFLWDILSGYHKSDTFESYHFYDVYGEMLWQLIPVSMRPWWADALKEITDSYGECPYRNCSIDYPPSMFEDKTEDFVKFEEDVAASLPSMANALNRSEIVNQNVLCPFGCSESCRNSQPIQWELMIQFILKKANLNLLADDAKKYRFYMASSDNYFRRGDGYFSLLMNEDWKVRPSVILTKSQGWAALACAKHKGLGDKSRLYPPINAYNFNLNARQTDQIGPIQMRPRVAKQARASKYGCGSRMNTQEFDYKGVDSFTITQDPSLRSVSYLQSLHYAVSIAGRNDIRSHLSNMGETGEIEPGMVADLMNFSNEMFPNGIAKDCLDGSTYVPYSIVMRHYLSLNREMDVIHRRFVEGTDIPVDKQIKRSWPHLINTIQKEDSSGFGYQFRSIPPFKGKCSSVNVLPSWILFSLLSSTAEMWDLVDSTTHFQQNQWPGHVLTNIGHHCFQNDTVTASRKGPFKKTGLKDMSITVNSCLGIDSSVPCMDELNEDLLSAMFGLYGDVVRVFGVSPDEEPLTGITGETKFIVFVTSDAIYNEITIDGHVFEHRVLCCMKEKRGGFEGVRLMRHGGKFSSYWQQHRDVWITAQYQNGSDLSMLHLSDDWHFVSLFVRNESRPTLDSYRIDFMKSLGGQAHVQCQCCSFPLIPSHAPKEKKLRCNAWTGAPSQYEQCSRKESYICSSPGCNVRCCMRCFKEKPTTEITFLVPHDNDMNDAVVEGNVTRGDDDDGDIERDDEEVFLDTDIGNMPLFSESDLNDTLIEGLVGPNDLSAQENAISFDHTCPHLVYTEQDDNFESNDDINVNDTVPTTNAGIFPARVFQREKTGTVSGNVLLNQVAHTLNRYTSRINGTQKEKHFVQRLCAARGGQSLGLLYPESGIFVRHFYASASADKLSLIGSIPLYMYRGGYHLGFATIEDHLRSRITNQSSTIATDPSYVNFSYDVMMNQALGKSDSRTLAYRGLRVSENGNQLSPREEDSNDDIFDDQMKGDVDGHRNVRNLCASMKYIQWSHFYTITLNHRDHPGIKDVFEWKEYQSWLQNHPEYPHLSSASRDEFTRSFEDAYMHMVTPKWIDIMEVFIHNIKDTLTHIGAVTALFARHEYQETAGNTSHIHMILAVDEKSMDKDGVKEYLNDLIAGHVMEVVPPEDVEDWIGEGFLVDRYDAKIVEYLAQTILSHICSPRCQRRVKSKGDENDTKCRKLHSVRDSPDPTEDCFVSIDYEWGVSAQELLEKIGLFNKESGKYEHSWFTPTRHMTACQPNATCNMSPVDRKLFAVLRSMQNLQYLLHTNGVCKYVVKYLVKIDQGNRITLYVNTKTGQIQAGKEFLHNTKISSSRINEDKWHDKQRHSKNPTGVEIAITQIIHKVLLRDEVITNLNFVDINTQSFECRPQTKYELKKRKSTSRSEENSEENDNDIADRQDSSMPTQRLREELDEAYHITDGQKLTYGEKKSDKYDRVSEFSLREPRLLKVANTLEIYYRCFCVDKTIQKDEKIAFSNNQMVDTWYDCLRRRIRVRLSALDILEEHVLSNMDEYEGEDAAIEMNTTVLEIIRLAKADDLDLSPSRLRQKKVIIDTFIVSDAGLLPPIPVFSNITPANPQQFIIHLLLTLGKYDTEKDLLLKPSLIESFREGRLVGSDDDEEALLKDVGAILRRYITEQLIFSPFPLSKAEYYMLIGNQVIMDAIIHGGISMNEMPPFTVVGLLEKNDADQSNLWKRIKGNQLDSILYQVKVDGAPDKDQLMACDRNNPISWSPLDLFTMSPQQSEESYDEQKVAIDVVVKEMNTYIDHEARLQSKNVIIHGCSGAVKSFISFYCSLYGISQGLNIFPTSLAGVNAARIGGQHWHNLFCLDGGQTSAPPSRQAELALTRINRDSLKVYKLTTMDVLFFDEFFQFSSEQLAVTELILRKIRRSNLPFGGVFILANMDHAQGAAIGGTPIILSSFMTTTFALVELNHSVRAHNDPDFQRLQKIARMSPLLLQQRPDLVAEFRQLLSSTLTFVDSWDSDQILPLMLRVFSKRVSTTDALNEGTQQTINYFEGSGLNYVVAQSQDKQRVQGSHEWSDASEQTVKSLNQKLREVQTLCLYRGAKFEITMNDITHRDEPRFYQSQVVVIYEVPTADMIDRRASIPVLMPPPSAESEIDFDDDDNCPTQDELLQQGWKKVLIPIASHRNQVLMVRGGFEAKREQYALRPLGASTISKCQGLTLPSGLAVEVSRQNAPWEKSQMVVYTSRSKTGSKTVIVGDKTYAINLMCELLQKPNEYTKLIEDLIAMLSVNSTRRVERPVYGIDLRESYPFRMIHYQVPQDSSGFCYILYSLKDKRVTYTGETENLANRLLQHNSGNGSDGTAPASLRPWALGAFIVGSRLNEKSVRCTVERKWRDAIRREGSMNIASLQRILLVRDVVNSLNNYDDSMDTTESRYRYVITVESGNDSNNVSNDNNVHFTENANEDDDLIEPYDIFGTNNM